MRGRMASYPSMPMISTMGVSEFLLHCPASKIQPSLIEKRTKLVLAGKPDHQRRGVRQEMKESFTRLEGFCRALAFRDVASNLGSANYLPSRFFNRCDGKRNDKWAAVFTNTRRHVVLDAFTPPQPLKDFFFLVASLGRN
jgi:hypothetical protein